MAPLSVPIASCSASRDRSMLCNMKGGLLSRVIGRADYRNIPPASPGSSGHLAEYSRCRGNHMRSLSPRMAVRRSGKGPDLVLFHGGMGSWKHWSRNLDVLSARFTVHALDHPSYGDSASVSPETTGGAYLDLVHGLFREMFPGEAPLRFAGFSFGGAIAANLARRLAPRVTHLCLVSPGGFPSRRFGDRPTRSSREAGGDCRLFREICRHSLLVNRLSDPRSISEETLDIQVDCVRRTRFNSRKVSGGGTLLGDLAQLRSGACRIFFFKQKTAYEMPK